MACKEPERRDQDDPDKDDGDSLEIDRHAHQSQPCVIEGRKAVVRAQKAEVAQQLQDARPQREGDDDLGQLHPPDADQDQSIEGSAECGDQDDGQGERGVVTELEPIKEEPRGEAS